MHGAKKHKILLHDCHNAAVKVISMLGAEFSLSAHICVHTILSSITVFYFSTLICVFLCGCAPCVTVVVNLYLWT